MFALIINGKIQTNKVDEFVEGFNKLIDQTDSLALVVLQYNTNKLLDLDSSTLLSDVIKRTQSTFEMKKKAKLF